MLRSGEQLREIKSGNVKPWWLIIGGVLVAVYLFLIFFYSFKSLPEDLNYQSSDYLVDGDDLTFLSDLTFENARHLYQSEQEIFDTVFAYIDQAEQYILVDMFLFNNFSGGHKAANRKLSSELTEKLLAKKNNRPDIMIDLIVDPINTVYGGFDNSQLNLLAAAGINVVVTDLWSLRDDNPMYAAVWRLFFAAFGNAERGWLPHPFDKGGKRVSLRSYLAMLNFKANHRKVFLMDHQGELLSIIGSANVHDASSSHSNTAVVVKGLFGREIYRAEEAVAKLSKNSLQPLPANLLNEKLGANDYATVNLLTEGKIKRAALTMIDGLQGGDRLWVAMFYLSDRQIIKALIDAAERGADIRIILDPSKDAFGYSKNGIPNRPVAAELSQRSAEKIQVRWYRTFGEQFHTKMMLAIDQTEQTADLLIGSANFTKRNVGNFNLEANVRIRGGGDLPFFIETLEYFEKLWTNVGGDIYTVDYVNYRDESRLKYWFYRWQETTGLSSF